MYGIFLYGMNSNAQTEIMVLRLVATDNLETVITQLTIEIHKKVKY
jgi:hypothetical protein